MYVRGFLVLLVFLFFVGCANTKEMILFNKELSQQKNESKNNMTSLVENVEFEYKIVPDDRVNIIFYQHPELSTLKPNSRNYNEGGLLVDSKGYIRLPLIKKIHIAGLTQNEALEKIENAYKKYIKSPDINFEVLNKRAYIIGEVKRPGEIDLNNEKLTLLQIIAKAGDLTDLANRKLILILRSQGNGIKKEVIDLTNINSLTISNIFIRPNDIVYIAPLEMKAFNLNVSQVDPMFRLLSDILSPFVSIKYLSR